MENVIANFNEMKKSDESISDALEFVLTEHHRFRELNDEVAALTESLDDCDSEIGALKEKLEDRDEQIQELESKVEHYEDVLNDICHRANQSLP